MKVGLSYLVGLWTVLLSMQRILGMVAASPRGGARTRLSSTIASSSSSTSSTADSFHNAGEMVVDDPAEVSV